MARGGRPTERPVHLTPEERQQAQTQTAEWRRLAGLSQPEMADRVGVGHSTYRMWESGKEPYAGPTRPQAQQLDRVLQGLIGDQYASSRAFEVWGWPGDLDMSYPEVAELLREAGFSLPGAQPTPPSAVFLVHRLREPNLVHGVFALAAAAATRAGLSVHMLLDDTAGASSSRPGLPEEFESALSRWFTFAAGDESKLTIMLYSAILTDRLLAQQGWAAVSSYLSTKTGVLEILLASKAVSPLQYNVAADQSVLELVRQAESLRADRLITPLRNWIAFEAELARLVAVGRPGGQPASVVTLGGEDERILWDIWHRGCAQDLSERVQHIFLQPVPMPSYRVPWQERALTARTSRPWLAAYLKNRGETDGDNELIEWMLRAAIGLPAALNAGFRASLPAPLASPVTLRRGSPAELSRVVPAIAEAVVSWLSP